MLLLNVGTQANLDILKAGLDTLQEVIVDLRLGAPQSYAS
jgi:hypothetical protein